MPTVVRCAVALALLAAAPAARAVQCAPAQINASAVLPGTQLSVSPLPNSYDASPQTQISLLGVPAPAIASLSVTGSSSGAHAGALRAYSQGDGASFVPQKGFTPGETVTVRGSTAGGGTQTPFAFRFTVAYEDSMTVPLATAAAAQAAPAVQHFRSRTDLRPPQLTVTLDSPSAGSGYVFATAYDVGGDRGGPAIYDNAGNVVWFKALRAPLSAANLQLQQLAGAPVLTWWQGTVLEEGFGQGVDVIADTRYRQRVVRAGNGYSADLHDFQLTPQGTALLTAFAPIACDLRSLRGPANGDVTDAIVQEVDLATGLVRREWHSLDHVSLRNSYALAQPGTSRWPFDYFHANSIAIEPNGQLLISARNTWALYVLDEHSGQVTTTIGGKSTSLVLAAGAGTAWQHDARLLPDGTISVFDNGSSPKVHTQSRAVVLSLSNGTVSVTRQFAHPTPLLAGSQGNAQLEPGGDFFIGWGGQPYMSEFTPDGSLVWDAHFQAPQQPYRAFRFPWTASSPNPPALALERNGDGTVTVDASWNGETQVASWRVLAGSDRNHLGAVASAPKAGFETRIPTSSRGPFVAVQALDATGAVLGTSKPLAA